MKEIQYKWYQWNHLAAVLTQGTIGFLLVFGFLVYGNHGIDWNLIIRTNGIRFHRFVTVKPEKLHENQRQDGSK